MLDSKFKVLLVLLGILSIFSIGFIYFPEENCDDCNDVYLDICFDKESIFYRCNLETEMCVLNDWKIVNFIKHLESGDISIYGVPTCSWCTKQLAEFGQWEEYVRNNLYVDCSLNINERVCKNVKSTPSWGVNGVIAYEGFIDISSLEINE